MRPDIVFSGSLWDEVHRHLIRTSADNPHPSEEQAFLLASLNESPFGLRLLVREAMPAMPADLLEQSSGGIKPTPEFVERMINRCTAEGLSLIEVHSHPFDDTDTTTFSSRDWTNDRRKMSMMALHMAFGFRHATMVVGQNSVDAHLFEPATREIVPIEQITVVGDYQGRGYTQLATTGSRSQGAAFSADLRHQRQLLFFGEAVQHLLSNLTVAIVGVSGLGSHVALQLAHLGVGHLLLIDPQRAEPTNLNRLLGVGEWAVGQLKVEVYRQLIERIAPRTRVTALPVPLLSDTGLYYAKGTDILFGCVDNHGARLILNQLASRYLIPLIDGGTGIKLPHAKRRALSVGGQVQVVLPGTGCLECRRAIDVNRAQFDLLSKEDQAFERSLGYGSEETVPSVVMLNGVIASLQVTELLSLLSGRTLTCDQQAGTILYNAQTRQVNQAIFPEEADCPTCGRTGVLGVGDTAPLVRAVQSRKHIPAVVKPKEYKQEEPQTLPKEHEDMPKPLPVNPGVSKRSTPTVEQPKALPVQQTKTPPPLFVVWLLVFLAVVILAVLFLAARAAGGTLFAVFVLVPASLPACPIASSALAKEHDHVIP